jgi:glutaredoxin 3
MNNFTIYGNEKCYWCRRAKVLLSSHDIGYVFINTDEDQNLNELKRLLPYAKTIPQIWDNENTHVGGYHDLEDLLEESFGPRDIVSE